MKITILIFSTIVHFVVTTSNSAKNNIEYWLPKLIVKKDASHPGVQTNTTFGYNDRFELISITKSKSFNRHVYTAFIAYNNEGLVSKVKQTSSNPLIKEKNFQFIYEGTTITQIRSLYKGVEKKTLVSYDPVKNEYSYQNNHTQWHFEFDIDNNLKKIQAGDFTRIETSSNMLNGICRDILMQPALFLVQEELESINSFSLALYNTREVKTVLYNGVEFCIENKVNEYGNVTWINAHNNSALAAEFIIAYEEQGMKL